MSSEQHAWSEEKQQRLHEQLTGVWTEDVWVIGRKDTPKKQGRIRFTLTSPSLKIELKYALWHKFDSGQWRLESDAIQRTAFLTIIFRWLDHFTPPIQSLMEKSLDQWEISLRSYLIQKGYYKRKVRKALNTTQQYVEHTFEDKRICLFRQLYTIVFDAYDDRPETEKDRWDLRKLGIQIRLTKSQYYLNFAHIAPSWLLQLTKQYMQYNLAVHSPADCEWKLICIRSLSEFLTTYEPTVQARDLDRALMVRYMHFLRERYPTARTRNHILVDLRAFLETCTYHL
jgi:hypothetical protein